MLPEGTGDPALLGDHGDAASEGLGHRIASGSPRTNGDGQQLITIHPGMSIASAEQLLIEATLAKLDGNKKVAAEQLGISVKTLYSRLQVYAAMSHGRAAPLPPPTGEPAPDGN
jgi:DNA-binding NtrC family response regulator